jgi:dTDP-glucose 4,6-dehydratase
MKRILLTGASGFVGSHILDHLLVNTDWDIVCVASWKHKGTPERILESDHYKTHADRVEVITHDLVSPFTDHTIEKMGKFDYIINVASESHVDRSITNPVPFAQNNFSLALNMLELARKIQPEKFIQFSTDEVFGVAPDGVNHHEWSPIIPSNPYAASKAAQEALAISYWRTYGVPVIITNCMNIFGERQDKEKYIAQLISKIDNGEKVTVHGKEGYIGSRFYLHARNAADMILFILNTVKPTMFDDGDTTRPERFNIVGNEEINNLELAEKVAKLMGKDLNYELQDFHGTRPGHDRRYALDGSKIRDLGWETPLDLDGSLQKTIDWTLDNREWL